MTAALRGRIGGDSGEDRVLAARDPAWVAAGGGDGDPVLGLEETAGQGLHDELLQAPVHVQAVAGLIGR